MARFAARLGYPVRLSKVYLVAEQAVEHIIMPLSLPEAGTPADSFSGKTLSSQVRVARNVCDAGLSFNPVHLRMQEQVTR